jgi:hypothetical protein
MKWRDIFEGPMKYLHDNQYTTLRIEEPLRFTKGAAVADKSIVLMFDD